MVNLVTPEGAIVTPGRWHSMAEAGPHQGTWWRVDEVFHDGAAWMVRASRKHRTGRVRAVFHPSHLGLVVREEFTRVRVTLNRLHHGWQKFDEWLIVGVVALVPLAFFEHYHLAERVFALFGEGGH